ncbi:hypothetical protein [Massilia horti]|uniref:Lipoprotein n=1 Tax=Massilia horti TaxID=2562153 RepID=A0A4Y9STT9_9BURK|nr:hypothetical protein [Massilia horti]TFW29885.1 hypothetical protein E4O92_17875 [Massilia horti]
MKSSPFLLFCLFLPAFTAAAELVTTCDIGGKISSRVDAIRDSRIADTYVYYLRQNGSVRPFFGDKDSSRGSSVQIACVGRKTRALVVTGEFTANFLQGFVLTRNPKSGVVERLDFAEKSRPAWLYLTPSETTIVVPTHGYGETNKKFIVYRHFVGSSAEPLVVPMDELPRQAGADVIKLGGHQSR